jgi:hypothetical protein
MTISVDTIKNQSSGKRGTAKDSLYFNVGSDSSSATHDVTLNYGTGHFCTCRGMISKIRKFGAVSTLNTHQSLSLPPTSRHFCKHIHAVRSADPELRIEARRLRNEHFGISETPTDPETGRTSGEMSAPGTGRRAAVRATHEKRAARGDEGARERLAEIEAQAAALREQIEIEDALENLYKQYGKKAVISSMQAA